LSAANKTGYGWSSFSRLLFWQAKPSENNSAPKNSHDTLLNDTEEYVGRFIQKT